MRSDLEPVSPRREHTPVVNFRILNSMTTLIDDLHELIAALDRRAPRLERDGEVAIARDAAALKDAALRRIAELEHEEQATSIPMQPALFQR
jgi:hypothetical protein